MTLDLTDHRTLGRSGLVVSPLALGTMTFGADRWGTDEAASREVLETFVEAGGTFVDTADVYAGGRSEELLGRMIADHGWRDRVVLATKFGFPRTSGTPLRGGNGARNIRWALEGSLERLRTDHVDLYWMHVWDRTTPVEEVLQALTDAVRAGTVLHYGFSNTPAWYVAQVATLARAHGLPGPIGLQYGYSLVDRGVELDVLPAGEALGLGLVPWSPLGAGLLTGKYGREVLERTDRSESTDAGRLNGPNPMGDLLFTERNLDVVDVLRDVARELDRPMAQVALAWVARWPGVSSVLVGASSAEQLRQNIGALELDLADEQRDRLDAVSALPSISPYSIFRLPSEAVFGAPVAGWPRA